MNPLRTLIADRIRRHGPISVAEYMDLALYHPYYGYYACAPRRTGRAGDFFTSGDVGPLFGELLARQFAEMWRLLQNPSSTIPESPIPNPQSPIPNPQSPIPNPQPPIPNPQPPIPNPQSPIPNPQPPCFDLVEAAAGDGRLARDILDAAAHLDPEWYACIRLHLVEAAPAARAAQIETLGSHAGVLASSSAALPDAIDGVVFANELLDALPTHAVIMRADGLREIFIDVRGDSLVPYEAAPSTPALWDYLDRAGVRLECGWRAEINLQTVQWVRQAARALRRGFLVLIDYGYPAAELYSAAHAAGTLATFRRHVSSDWHALLDAPGEHDITAHVDLSTVTRTCEEEGLVTLGRLDQTYFLLALGVGDLFSVNETSAQVDLAKRLAFKTLILPGGLGSTLKVLIFGKAVGTPALAGLSWGARLT